MCNVSGVTAINTGGDLVQPELPFASGPRVQSISSKSLKALSLRQYMSEPCV